MGDDIKVKKRQRVKGKKFPTLAHRLDYLYGKDAKTYTLYGKTLFRDGMNFEHRKCTDIICLILFWIMLAVKIFLFYWGWTRGDINKVMSGVDGAGN